LALRAVVISQQNDSAGRTSGFMNTAPSRIRAFFTRHDRREEKDQARRRYCVCGALKQEEAKEQGSGTGQAGSLSGRTLYVQKLKSLLIGS